jgi:Pentatricopeptide repeat domain
VEACWHKVVHDLRVTPDEGTCLDVLNTAGRHGLPNLAVDVFQVLTDMKVRLQEYHFGPLIEAFCVRGMIKDALGTLTVMTDADVQPEPGTTYPIYKVIQSSWDTLETACAALESLWDEGKAIHSAALNSVLKGSVGLGDLQRAVGILNSFPKFNVKPVVETFNLLLGGCVVAENRDLGDKLLLEMKEMAIQPNLQTYENLIILCLTQKTYEDAFFYLEEMKGLNMVPPVSVYEALVRRCASMGDTRYKLAVEEMTDCGYDVSKQLEAFINGERGEGEGMEPQPVSAQKYSKGVNRHKRLHFMQTRESV